MTMYLIAYYGKSSPSFTYAETLEEARSSALTLLNSQHCKQNDILSIVEVATDSIIFYGKRDEVLAKLTNAGQATVSQPVKSSWRLSLKSVLNWISLKLAGPTVRQDEAYRLR